MTDDLPPAEPGTRPARPALMRWLSGRSVLALVVSVIALGFAAAPWVSPDLFGSRVRAYLLAHPEVLDEAVTARQANEDLARVAQTNAAIAANPAFLRPDPADPSVGPENAKVTVIEFFDFRCPGCKAVAPDYLRLVRSAVGRAVRVQGLADPGSRRRSAGVAICGARRHRGEQAGEISGGV
ncbi:hypothetical protein KOAAANKH_03268 [Brevundimonas sp. NIBR10]|uniref:DsbA family protein n=1 Tax=Brevundimonas sp. NIBR10 TaxID=3015997 RepID=UPI0022F1533E|nr:thioredoxin domain-containing protein [Brevundimonas sp. NIBR10]WGM48370.1 hypothetical protein KOAAANKH_03268 [Brevundimonas sp. NIBR10]